MSPERARLAPKGGRREITPQAGEKLLLALASGAFAVLLLGTGQVLAATGWLGLLVLTLFVLAFFVGSLLTFGRSELKALPRLIVLACFLLLNLAALRALEATFGLDELAYLPLSFTGLVLALTFNRALAVACTLLLGALFALFILLPAGGSELVGLHGLAVCLSGGLSAALAAGRLRRRSALVRIGFLTGFVQVLVAGGFLMLETDPLARVWGAGDLVLLGLSGVAVGLVVSGFLPAIERLFQVTTDVSLLELGSTQEQPLLRKLLLEATGTFHHSYIVGLISEAAAEAVGANPLLARVGSLYHDIGKLNKPDYFAENAPEAPERHRSLTPEMSNLIISSHTRDGVELGAYHGLPQVVLDFMTEHHGTTCMEYFLTRAKELRGAENVPEESFRYPGPRPQSLETAIVMIADSVEAISRQIPEPTTTRLREMVHEVVIKRLMDRQFDDCRITLRDLARIEEACTQVLSGIYHTRPKYPKGRPHPLDLAHPPHDRRGSGSERRGTGSRTATGGGP